MDRINVVQIADAQTTTGAAAQEYDPAKSLMTFQAQGVTSSGSGTATVLIQGSLDGSVWVLLGTMTLTLETTLAAGVHDGIAINAPWNKIRANVSAISGTGAAVDAFMGVEI